MNNIVKIFLCLWLCFITGPTIISLVFEESASNIAYNISEEENHNESKQNISEEPLEEYLIFTNSYAMLKLKHRPQINSQYNINHDFVFDEVFSPPPELV